MTEVRVASLRLASVAAALLLQQRQLEQAQDDDDDDDEEEEDEDEDDDGNAAVTGPVKRPVKSPLRVVYYKDPSELCTAVNDRQIAQQGGCT